MVKAVVADTSSVLEGNTDPLNGLAGEGPPVRRVHIPKGDGCTTRPIGIPTFEDKVLQRAVVALLEPLYEHDFLDCSYGFRPGRSAHQAIKTVWDGLTSMGGGWIIDLDIQAFFDTIDHQHLREFLQQRVKDGVILRLVIKRKTAKGRFQRGLKHIACWCRGNRHLPILEQHRMLRRKVQGHFAYYGIRGNMRSLQGFRYRVERIGIKWLSKRSQKAQIAWDRGRQLLQRLPLPMPRIVQLC